MKSQSYDLPNKLPNEPLISIEISPSSVMPVMPSIKTKPIIDNLYSMSHPLILNALEEDQNSMIPSEIANKIMTDTALTLTDHQAEINDQKMTYTNFFSLISSKASQVAEGDFGRKVPKLVLLRTSLQGDSADGIFHGSANEDFSKKINLFTQSLENIGVSQPEIDWLRQIYNQNCLHGIGGNFIAQMQTKTDLVDKTALQRVCFFDHIQDKQENTPQELEQVDDPIYFKLDGNNSVKSLIIVNTLEVLITSSNIKLPFFIQTKTEIEFDNTVPKTSIGTAKIESVKINLEIHRKIDSKGEKTPIDSKTKLADIQNYLVKIISFVNKNYSKDQKDKTKEFTKILCEAAGISVPPTQNIFSSITNKIVNFFKSSSENSLATETESSEQEISKLNEPKKGSIFRSILNIISISDFFELFSKKSVVTKDKQGQNPNTAQQPNSNSTTLPNSPPLNPPKLLNNTHTEEHSH